MASTIDWDEGFIMDFSDGSVSPLTSSGSFYSSSDTESKLDGKIPKEELANPEDDSGDECVIYFNQGTVVGKDEDGKPIRRFKSSEALAGKAMTEELYKKSGDVKPTRQNIPPHLSRRDYITMEEFKLALRIYENNQLSELAKPSPDYGYLNMLENWFIQVFEPKPEARWKGRLRGSEIIEYNKDIEDWINREKLKLKGYSYFCDHDVRKKIRIDPDTKVLIQERIRKLIIMKNEGKFSRRR